MATIHNQTIHISSLCVTARNESDWYSSNPVLKLGEIAVSLQSPHQSYSGLSGGNVQKSPNSTPFIRVKIGNGSDTWRNLPYLDAMNETDINAIAVISASSLNSLDERLSALENAVSSLSDALLGITNSIITNISRQ